MSHACFPHFQPVLSCYLDRKPSVMSVFALFFFIYVYFHICCWDLVMIGCLLPKNLVNKNVTEHVKIYAIMYCQEAIKSFWMC